MPPTITSIHLVGASGSNAHVVALEALRKAFPDLTVRHCGDLAEALAHPPTSRPELLVLLAPRSGDIAKATAALDTRGLSRWSVVARGAAATGSTSPFFNVGADDWSAPVLAHAVNSAVALHALERTNARLRGDLQTVSRRFTHDLRTPLNCISTASEALREPGAGEENGPLFAQAITDSVDEAVALLERLGFVLKATANPLPLQPVTMEEIVWGTLQRLETRIVKAGATVIKPPAWPAVVGVPAWIDLIWVNLIRNSLEHAGPKPRIELGWEAREHDCRFWVRDSGQGVPPERRARLFFPFDRLSDLNAPRTYGLSIVQRLVELQRGDCGYEAEPAPGGTFFFVLPHA